jgi:hypothetical protein
VENNIKEALEWVKVAIGLLTVIAVPMLIYYIKSEISKATFNIFERVSREISRAYEAFQKETALIKAEMSLIEKQKIESDMNQKIIRLETEQINKKLDAIDSKMEKLGIGR